MRHFALDFTLRQKYYSEIIKLLKNFVAYHFDLVARVPLTITWLLNFQMI